MNFKQALNIEDLRAIARKRLPRIADGIFVSNHGGRQLDGAISPMDVLPQIAAAVGGRLAIMVDSGFRRGSDVVKALALGADMVFVGRATLFGATAGGEAGALHALVLLKSEVGRVMALLGCNSIAELGPHYLRFDEAPRADQARMVLQRQAV